MAGVSPDHIMGISAPAVEADGHEDPAARAAAIAAAVATALHFGGLQTLEGNVEELSALWDGGFAEEPTDRPKALAEQARLDREL
jgi:hypothetical protein